MEADSIQRVVDWCTVAKSDMPPRKSVLDNETAKAAFAEGGLKTFAEQILPGGRAEPRLPPEVYKAVSDAIQATQLSGADPAQAADTAATQIETFLATYNGVPILSTFLRPPNRSKRRRGSTQRWCRAVPVSRESTGSGWRRPCSCCRTRSVSSCFL